MIVRDAHDSVHLITQPDHARLAREIMARCVALDAHPRRAAVLRAIGEHDNGWAEVDSAPSVDPATGAVVDFVHLPVGERQAVWPRGIARLAPDSWAAALVAHHAITVYDRFRPDPEWTGFFAGLESSRAAMLGASGGSFEELEADYGFLRLGDLISLAFCAGWSDEQSFREWRVRLSGTTVVVTPDPFGGGEIPIEISARELAVGRFRSDEELREAVGKAPTVALRGVVGVGPG